MKREKSSVLQLTSVLNIKPSYLTKSNQIMKTTKLNQTYMFLSSILHKKALILTKIKEREKIKKKTINIYHSNLSLKKVTIVIADE